MSSSVSILIINLTTKLINVIIIKFYSHDLMIKSLMNTIPATLFSLRAPSCVQNSLGITQFCVQCELTLGDRWFCFSSFSVTVKSCKRCVEWIQHCEFGKFKSCIECEEIMTELSYKITSERQIITNNNTESVVPLVGFLVSCYC